MFGVKGHRNSTRLTFCISCFPPSGANNKQRPMLESQLLGRPLRFRRTVRIADHADIGRLQAALLRQLLSKRLRLMELVGSGHQRQLGGETRRETGQFCCPAGWLGGRIRNQYKGILCLAYLPRCYSNNNEKCKTNERPKSQTLHGRSNKIKSFPIKSCLSRLYSFTFLSPVFA